MGSKKLDRKKSSIIKKVRACKKKCEGRNFKFSCSCDRGKFPPGWHIDKAVKVEQDGKVKWPHDECFGCGKHAKASCICLGKRDS
jgi:hypothetical protein